MFEYIVHYLNGSSRTLRSEGYRAEGPLIFFGNIIVPLINIALIEQTEIENVENKKD